MRRKLNRPSAHLIIWQRHCLYGHVPVVLFVLLVWGRCGVPTAFHLTLRWAGSWLAILLCQCCHDLACVSNKHARGCQVLELSTLEARQLIEAMGGKLRCVGADIHAA